MREEMDGLKVTAYALGELDDAERAALEARLAASEGARRDVAEVREAADALREAYRSMPRYELTPEQRRAVEAAAAREPGVPAARRRWPRLLRVGGFTAAAAAAVVAVLSVSIPSLLRARIAVPHRDAAARPASTVAPYQQARDRFTPGSAPLPMPLENKQRLNARYDGTDAEKELQGLRESSAPFNTEAYDHISDNPFVLVAQDPRSTFSVDVDTV